MELGRLEEVDIRQLWPHEEYDFSRWLAEDDNIEEINQIIGLTLTELSREVYVGSYRCDLLAKDETTGVRVVIENQLEATDHDHLGKIITYASGLNAEVIIWIVKEAREEHRSAIEWLNHHLPADISFFLLEIRAYRIGDSLAAPMFMVIEEPNDFNKNRKSISQESEMSKTEAERLNFWIQFNKHLAKKGKPFNLRKPSTDHWYNVAIGTSRAHLVLNLLNQQKRCSVEFYIRDDHEFYDTLYAQKDQIEAQLGLDLVWDYQEGRKHTRITHFIPGLDFDYQENYPQLMDEIIDKAVLMRRVFQEYV